MVGRQARHSEYGTGVIIEEGTGILTIAFGARGIKKIAKDFVEIISSAPFKPKKTPSMNDLIFFVTALTGTMVGIVLLPNAALNAFNLVLNSASVIASFFVITTISVFAVNPLP